MKDWSWATATVPPREECVLRYLLEERARTSPDKVFVRFEDDTCWTYAQTWNAARRAAAGLAALGLKRGDVVLVFLPNGSDYLKTWFGASLLGAAVAAVNTAYKGAVLEHQARLVDARLAVVHAGLIHRFEGLDLPSLEHIVEVGDPSGVSLPTAIISGLRVLDTPNPESAPDVVVEPWDTLFVLYTSGTTGPSKGVIVPYVQQYDMCMATFGGRLTADDHYLLNMPLFHVSGTRAAFGMLLLGGSFSLIGHFKTASFWDVVREHKATACVLLGAAAAFLEAQAETPEDADNPMRLISMVPMLKDPQRFARRFGVDIVTAYGMSELSIPIMSDVNPQVTDSCGRLRPGYQARIVDEHDRELPEGEVGELILRAERPWTITPGYWRMPEATAEAWRNGWFHTGDAFRRDSEGNYFFVDRKKDAIRRRGENISSYEVEVELYAHPEVKEAAALAIPSEEGEDEVMAAVALNPGSSVTPIELFEFLQPRMAHFMLPRYIRFLPDLPKTASLRVQKHLLRADGVTLDTWDREAAGINVRREKIVGA